METRKPLDVRASFAMVLLCATWGLQQVGFKASANAISPLLQVSLRSGIAALLVMATVAFRKDRFVESATAWKPGIVVGFLFAAEYLLVGQAVRYTSASHSTTLLYTSPIFAALGLHWRVVSERLKPVQWFGILLAFFGVAATIAGQGKGTMDSATNVVLGDLLALLAGLSYGATTVVIRTSVLSRVPAFQTLLYQLVGAFVLLLGATFAFGQTQFVLTPLSGANLAFQTLIVSYLSFMVWFSLLRTYVASRLGVLAFMTPLFGIAFGAWLLHEPIEPSFAVGAVLVLSGAFLVGGYDYLRSVWGKGRVQGSA